MQFRRKLNGNGPSVTLTIPKDICEYLGLKDNDEIVIQIEEGKHGKYVSFFKAEKEGVHDTDTQAT